MKQIVDPDQQIPGNQEYTEDISHFAERKLREGSKGYYDHKGGIEDRITRLEEFSAKLAEVMVKNDLLTAERVVEMLCGWHGSQIKVVDKPE